MRITEKLTAMKTPIIIYFLGVIPMSRQFGVQFEDGSYRKVSVRLSSHFEPEDCVRFLQKFEVRLYFEHDMLEIILFCMLMYCI